MTERVGLLVVNVGTPEAPREREVRRYLREFLSDPRVLDLPGWRRFLLLELVILRRRPRASAEAYRKIWTEEGSPLLVHGRALAAKLQRALGDGVRVELAMRYGAPSIAAALDRFEAAGIEQIALLPLYPQFSVAATGSAVERVKELAAVRRRPPSIQVIPPFYDHPAYLDARAALLSPQLTPHLEPVPERVYFSFHGLPERQVRRGGEGCLERADCCAAIAAANRSCYRAHCFATARSLAERLGLAPDRYAVGFQSRLGREPWIRPYFDELLAEEARRGVRDALLVPSFVNDCLETLEELGIRAVESWREHGGRSLRVAPAPNADDRFVAALAEIAADGSSFVASACLLRATERAKAH